ncbi:MAG: nuclear transport factor 2 family protein [Actinomycetota bacterium]
MTEESSVETMRRLYDAFAKRDADVMTEVLADCTFHIPGDGILAGTYRGAEEILGLFARGREESGGTLAFEVHDIVGDAEHAVGLDRVTARRGDRTIDMNRVIVAHAKDGKLTEIWLVPEDQYAFDEFWS